MHSPRISGAVAVGSLHYETTGFKTDGRSPRLSVLLVPLVYIEDAI